MVRERLKFSASVFCVVRRGDEVLSLRRSGTGWLDGHWSIPAGALDGDEPLAGAAMRELQEETGVCRPVAKARLAHVQQVFMPEAEWFGFYFEIENDLCAPKLMEPEKHDRLEWTNVLNFSEPVVPYVKTALGEIARGSNISTFLVS